MSRLYELERIPFLLRTPGLDESRVSGFSSPAPKVFGPWYRELAHARKPTWGPRVTVAETQVLVMRH
jgi:hypothetical protein